METLTIRRLQADDSLHEMQGLLKPALLSHGVRVPEVPTPKAAQGFVDGCLGRGDCHVAELAGHIVGTMTVQDADRTSPVRVLRERSVAALQGLVVRPTSQHAGIGSRLLQAAEGWAIDRHYTVLAVEIAEPARWLRSYYARHGFVPADVQSVSGRAHRSIVMCKRLVPPEVARTGRENPRDNALRGASTALPAPLRTALHRQSCGMLMAAPSSAATRLDGSLMRNVKFFHTN